MAWLNGWTFRQAITIASSTVGLSADVANIPVAVHVPVSNTSFWANVLATGFDVRFTDADGSTILNFEIESFDSVGKDAWYHVNIPSLTAAANKTIYLYYGNAGAASGENRTAVWDAQFTAVWHLNQDSSIGGFADATANALNGTNTATTDAAGQIDRARDFNANQYISMPNSALLAPQTQNLGIEFTFVTSSNNAAQYLWTDAGSSGETRLYIAIAPTYIWTTIKDGTNAAEGTTNLSLNNGQPHHLFVQREGTSLKVYVDGVLQATFTNALLGNVDTSLGTKVPTLGCYWDGVTRNNYFIGTIDEVTVSKGATARSLDWVKARYRSMLGAWLSFGVQEGVAQIIAAPVTTLSLIEPGASVFVTALVQAPVSTLALSAPDVLVGAIVVVSVPVATLSLSDPLPAIPERILPPVAVLNLVGGVPTVAINLKKLLLGVGNMPGGKTLSYKIVDEKGTLIQDWTSVGVTETVIDATAGKSVYYATTDLIGDGFQGVVLWKTNDPTPLTASEIITIHSSYMIGMRLTTDSDSVVLAEARNRANALPLLTDIEGSTVLAKQAKLNDLHDEAFGKWTLDPVAKTLTLYKADGVTVLKAFNLAEGLGHVPTYIERNPL